MEFWLDTADIAAIQKYQDLGLVDGVTTNPALLSEWTGTDILLKQICKMMGKRLVSIPVMETEKDKMYEQACMILQNYENAIVKIPATITGLEVVLMHDNRKRFNVTMAFHPTQFYPFIRVGVRYGSIFVDRVEDFGLESEHWNKGNIEKQQFKVIAASIRTPKSFRNAARWADIITVPPSTWDKVLNNPLTKHAEQEFLDAIGK